MTTEAGTRDAAPSQGCRESGQQEGQGMRSPLGSWRKCSFTDTHSAPRASPLRETALSCSKPPARMYVLWQPPETNTDAFYSFFLAEVLEANLNSNVLI